MPVTVVVGGQFGGEGKGKVAHFFSQKQEASVVVRCGGSNSGHTVVSENDSVHIFRHLPTAAILPDVKLALGAGSYIDVEVLLSEIHSIKLDFKRLLIDENAVIVDEIYKEKERKCLVSRISSTGSGTGAAVASRVMREQGLTFAKDVPELKSFICDVSSFLRNKLDVNERILIEGTQGFGLSVLHSPFYPYVTSRDTTAAAFVSEAGLSPRDVDNVVLTLRTFPIRVGGCSGPLPGEISWEMLHCSSGIQNLMEFTSVTRKPRRIATFDPELPKKAILVNQPNIIVLNHVDYLFSVRPNNNLIGSYLQKISCDLGSRIDYIGLGRKSMEIACE